MYFLEKGRPMLRYTEFIYGRDDSEQETSPYLREWLRDPQMRARAVGLLNMRFVPSLDDQDTYTKRKRHA